MESGNITQRKTIPCGNGKLTLQSWLELLSTLKKKTIFRMTCHPSAFSLQPSLMLQASTSRQRWLVSTLDRHRPRSTRGHPLIVSVYPDRFWPRFKHTSSAQDLTSAYCVTPQTSTLIHIYLRPEALNEWQQSPSEPNWKWNGNVLKFECIDAKVQRLLTIDYWLLTVVASNHNQLRD